MSRYQHRHTEISIQTQRAWLNALLSHIPDACALAIHVATGPIASTQSREFIAARVLQEAGYATLLLSALTGYEEKRDPDTHFDIPRITERLLAACEWARHQPQLMHLPQAMSASGTAAAACVRVAARMEAAPFALVSRGGRLDLAGSGPLRANPVPLLCITGGSRDNTRQSALQALPFLAASTEHYELATAGDLFVEPGTLDLAARATLEWFERWRPSSAPLLAPENL